jgi:hypothetical protein
LCVCVRLAQRGNSISKFRASTCGSAGVRVRCVPACHAALRVGARTRSGRGRAAPGRAYPWYSPRGHVKFWKVHVCMLNKRPEGLYHTSAAYSSGPGSRPDRATGRNRLRLRDGVRRSHTRTRRDRWSTSALSAPTRVPASASGRLRAATPSRSSAAATSTAHRPPPHARP